MKLNLNNMKYEVISVSSDGKQAVVKYHNIPKSLASAIGNGIRRSLLADIPGFAPVAFKLSAGNGVVIDSVLDVMESVAEIGNNVSGIRVKVLRPDLIDEFTLSYSGEIGGNLLAKNLVPTGKPINHADYTFDPDNFYRKNIKILNPNHLIFTNGNKDPVENRATIPIEIAFKSGVGFSTINDRHKLDGLQNTDSYHSVQSIFNPVTHAHFKTHANDGSSKYEDLELWVETDGSISPFDAISMSSKLLATYYTIFASNKSVSPTPVKAYEFGQPVHIESNDNLMATSDETFLYTDSTPVEDLDIDSSIYNALKIMGINTVGEMATAQKEGSIEKYFDSIRQVFDAEQIIGILEQANIDGVSYVQ